jgi:hypothetical protein
MAAFTKTLKQLQKTLYYDGSLRAIRGDFRECGKQILNFQNAAKGRDELPHPLACSNSPAIKFASA